MAKIKRPIPKTSNVQKRVDYLDSMLGTILIVQTPLTPSGYCRNLQGNLVDTISLGASVKKGQKVIAIRRIGTLGLEVEHFLDDHEFTENKVV